MCLEKIYRFSKEGCIPYLPSCSLQSKKLQLHYKAIIRVMLRDVDIYEL